MDGTAAQAQAGIKVRGINANADTRASATASARMILQTPASYADWVINLAREFLRATGQPEH